MKIIESKKENNTFWKKKTYIPNKKLVCSGTIEVNPNIKYQKIIGFGGALTEASAYALSFLDKKEQEKVIKSIYSKDGLNYSLGRVHINSCDFSLNNYCYVTDDDIELKTFSIEHEYKYVIPMIKMALKANPNLKLLASPWSPPAFMKDNNEQNHGGKLKDEYKQAWANYYVKYLNAMHDEGIPIKAITVQNEPLATQTWDSCVYSSEEERDFIKNYLGPTLVQNNLQDIDIYFYDHNMGAELLERANTVYKDILAANYVKGIAYHWYCSEDFASLSKCHELAPDKNIIFTEGCVEYGVYGEGAKMRFENGEHYAYHMINGFNNYNQAFIDWNVILDENGGPNHVGNFCEAPIMIDKNTKRVIYNSSYYYIGHFAKYIEKDAYRIETINQTNNDIYSASFLNPNGEIVTIILNKGNKYNLKLKINQKEHPLELAPQSILTIINKGE